MQNDRKHRDIKLVTAEYKRNKLAREPNYHSTKCISKHLLVMEMKKTEVKNKQANIFRTSCIRS